MRRLFAAVLLVVFVLTQAGCGVSNKNLQTDRQASDPVSSESSLTGGAEVLAAQLPADIPGKVTFETDQGKSAVLEYQANGKSQSVSLQDNQGLTWTLELPEGALADNTTIKITALNNVESEKLGKLEGGVMLEPDGLKFVNPAILKISGNGLDKNGIVLTGSHDGSRLDFAWNTDNKEALEARLLHFSTAYAGSMANQAVSQAAKDSWDYYKRYSQGVKEFLKTEIKNPPVPPSISLKCQKDGDAGAKAESEQLTKFSDDFMEPEIIYLQKLLSLGSAYEKAANGEESIDEKTGFQYEQQLAGRWLKKASMLIKQYKPDENKFTAVAGVTIAALKHYTLLGGDQDQTNYDQLMGRLSAWAYEISKKFLSELSNNHDYSYIHPLLRIYRLCWLLSASSGSDPLWEKIQEAMKFKVVVETHVDQDCGGGMHMGINTKSTLPFDLLGANAGNILMDGTGYYYDYSDPYQGEEGMSSDLKGEDFPVKGYLIDFNPCPVDGSGSFDILLDQFGAEAEHWSITITDEEEGDKTTVKESHLVRAIMKKLLEDKKVGGEDAALLGGDFYKFNMTVRNKDKTAAELTLSPAQNKYKADLTIKLIHTAPKFTPK